MSNLNSCLVKLRQKSNEWLDVYEIYFYKVEIELP